MSKHLVLLAVFICLPMLGCSNGNGSRVNPANLPNPPVAPTPPPPAPTPPPPPTPPPAPVPPEDVSGNWYTRTVNNAVNCNAGMFIDAQSLVIAQDENDITLLTSTGNTFSGTVNGDIVEWSGSFDERGGTTTITSLSITVSGSSASGNADWTWTNGVDSCNGTVEISASRDWNVEESQMNSTPRIADPLAITDGVAFATGVAQSIRDKEYFTFDVAADATVQVELSHFDAANDNLDLVILDGDENQVATSNSAFSFEKAEAQFQAGDTVIVGVLPMSDLANATYIISIDVN